jgi:hypothetical protein
MVRVFQHSLVLIFVTVILCWVHTSVGAQIEDRHASSPQSSPANDYVGKYDFGWMFGGGSITLSADGTFQNDSGSCTFTTRESGTYVVSNSRIRFKVLKYTGTHNDDIEVDLWSDTARREFFQYGKEDPDPPLKTEFTMYPVKWGERLYLIYDNDLADFTNAINLNVEPRDPGPLQNFYGLFFLREGDEQKQVNGKPSLPSKYQDLLLTDPITATIVEIQAKPTGKEKEQLAIIDKGRLAGVKVGMKFITPGQDPAFWSKDGVVLSVEDTSAKIEIYNGVAGETLTTRLVRKQSPQ